MAHSPSYNLKDFEEACDSTEHNVIVLDDAIITAKSDFNLHTQPAVLGFIGNGGLDRPAFINSALWHKNPIPENPIMVDAYNFFSGMTYGYLAFLFQPLTKKWIIKSFKQNEGADPRNLPFAEKLLPLKQKLFGGRNE